MCPLQEFKMSSWSKGPLTRIGIFTSDPIGPIPNIHFKWDLLPLILDQRSFKFDKREKKKAD
jgi:hypothetical protein